MDLSFLKLLLSGVVSQKQENLTNNVRNPEMTRQTASKDFGVGHEAEMALGSVLVD